MDNTKIRNHINILSKRHKKFSLIIKKVGNLDFSIPHWTTIEDAVLYSVIGQMLSNQAANSIINRLLAKLGSSKQIISWASNMYEKQGPLLGVSQRKRRALYEWRQFAKQSNNAWNNWHCLCLDDYRKEICSIWGFGRWSADMIGIFYLGRLDIWPYSDTGIINSCKVVFGVEDPRDITEYIRGCETTAALYLWELINRNLLKGFTNEKG